MTRILVSILLALLPAISGLMFNVPSRGEKCLKDEAKKDALITGQYDITALANTNMDIKVTDGKGHTLFQKEAASSGKFAFTLDTRDFINICFTSSYKEGISSAERSELKGAHSKVELTLKRGIEAKNYDEVAKAESLKPLEISMRRLEDLSLEIYARGLGSFFYGSSKSENLTNFLWLKIFRQIHFSCKSS